MRRHAQWGFILTVVLAMLTGCQTVEKPGQEEPEQKEEAKMGIHYMEIVCHDVDAQRAALERVHGLSFGPEVADLGQARVAEAPDGTLIGVRAPLAEHEQPIIRTYLEVEDIARAVEEAEAAGGVIAYPPTQQGDTGIWAIYILDGVQMGLWQR